MRYIFTAAEMCNQLICDNLGIEIVWHKFRIKRTMYLKRVDNEHLPNENSIDNHEQ